MLTIQLTADGSPTVLDETLGLHYHSLFGAVSESRHVFINGSGLQKRLDAYSEKGIAELRILEIGYGTGLNFVLGAELALRRPNVAFRFVGYEPYPLPAGHLSTFYNKLRHLELPDSQVGMALNSEAVTQADNITLEKRTLSWPDPAIEPLYYDLIFMDAFGPRSAPQLWNADSLGQLATALKPGGKLVSYSITGNTKRILQGLGLNIRKPRGFGPKWQMLVAEKPQN